jgi:hypothetical protein
MQIEEHAQEVMAYCAQLQKDFGRFKDDFDLARREFDRRGGPPDGDPPDEVQRDGTDRAAV